VARHRPHRSGAAAHLIRAEGRTETSAHGTPIWSGTISLGLLDMAVSLHTAERDVRGAHAVEHKGTVKYSDGSASEEKGATTNVVDFMALLKKSLESARKPQRAKASSRSGRTARGA
jgi:non-homologous end joining protein Ku